MRFTPAPPGIVRCPRCGFGAPAEIWRPGDTVSCSSCGSQLQVAVFPALEEATVPRRSEVALTGDSECFFHPGKKAERVCDRCGRFLCAVCDLPVAASHLCPACLQSGLLAGDRVPELVRKRVVWGRLALALALWPLLIAPFFFPLLLGTAVAAIFCVFYGWNKPGGIVTGRARVAAVAAIVIGLVELSGFAGLGILIWKGIKHGR